MSFSQTAAAKYATESYYEEEKKGLIKDDKPTRPNDGKDKPTIPKDIKTPSFNFITNFPSFDDIINYRQMMETEVIKKVITFDTFSRMIQLNDEMYDFSMSLFKKSKLYKRYSDEKKYQEDEHVDDIYQNIVDVYDTFFSYNIRCVRKMPEIELYWTYYLCKKQIKKISLVDEDGCVEFDAENIYFNEEKRLCIVNPR